MMFQSANNNTFGAKAREVLATVALMWLSMLLVVSFFKFVGLASVDFTSTPVLGATLNNWLDSHSLTLGEALTSPFVVIQVLIIILGAPFLEEVLFRGFFCGFLASDDSGTLKPRGVFAVLAGSFILFGLAHGHGYFSVLLQGVGGLFLARLWFRNGPNQRESYFSTVAAHSLYNISVVITTWIWLS